jgi:hypothetical protein
MAKPSPFPGMDPYIEPVWGPFHADYIAHLRQQLISQLPDGLYAQMEADVFVIEGQVRGRLVRPDVSAFSAVDPTSLPDPHRSGATAVAHPIRARVRRRPALLPHVVIREPRRGNRLVTAVEVLSPTNKDLARDRAIYRAKRDTYLMGSANVVEIDLLRAGANLMDLAPEDLPDETGVAYRACVRFASPDIGDHAEYYPIRLRERLPRIAVPLRSGDDDVTLDLQQAVAEVYADGRYDIQIDYAAPLEPPLDPPDAAWAAELIAAANG